MSLRSIIVQYVGDTLYLPPLEREVKHIIVGEYDERDWEHFELERTCRNESADGFLCSACSFGDFASFKFEPNYCPNCGAKVVSGFVTCKCGEELERLGRVQTCPACGRRVIA